MENRKSKKKVKVYTKKKKTADELGGLIEQIQSNYQSIDIEQIKKFNELPLSDKTLKGLKESGYLQPTEIQKQTIGLCLQGKDVLGAAQTGSGKTLAFLIPILEKLYCMKWTRLDGIGAIIIIPTRELAYQIFKCLRDIGRYHDFSAGLIIGGKDLKFERKRMDQCNIIICTPGRLLQHMDENPLFDCVNMQILVLDEADRCLDMGFEQAMNAIIGNLPPKRQTLLFSATQTKSVRDLVRLSLRDPAYVAIHENAAHTTPQGLQQTYVVCELEEKLSVIWSFIKSHKSKKLIIFFSTCKQVKYIYEIFCKMQPGLSLLALYGGLHQLRRMEIYETFCRKQSAVLFATDLAARGLDFPAVHWVVQADCPEDTSTYIHRVGRTARLEKDGESLLLLLPSEEGMIEQLAERKIPISRIEINPMKLTNPVRKMEAYLAKDPNLKATAQRAFVSYAKSVYLMKDKNVFNVHALNTDAYAKSLGLAIPPRIRFLQKLNKTSVQNTRITFDDQEVEATIKSDDESDSGVSNSEITLYKSELNAEIEKKPPAAAQAQREKGENFQVSDEESDDDILVVKRKNHDIDLPTEHDLEINCKDKNKKPVTKAAIAKKILRKKIQPNKKIVFGDDGTPVLSLTKDKRSELALEYEQENVGGINLEKAKLVLREEDKFDKQLFKEKVKLKHREEKRKRKQQRQPKDDFGTDSEDEPDVSWLPDPDKIYGQTTTNKKVKVVKPKGKKRKLESTLTINEAENLALMLLNK